MKFSLPVSALLFKKFLFKIYCHLPSTVISSTDPYPKSKTNKQCPYNQKLSLFLLASISESTARRCDDSVLKIALFLVPVIVSCLLAWTKYKLQIHIYTKPARPLRVHKELVRKVTCASYRDGQAFQNSIFICLVVRSLKDLLNIFQDYAYCLGVCSVLMEYARFVKLYPLEEGKIRALYSGFK